MARRQPRRRMLTVRLEGRPLRITYYSVRRNMAFERRVVDLLGRALLDAARGECPVDTGRLRRSLRLQRTGMFSRRITSSLDYFRYVRDGTPRQRANPFPRRARARIRSARASLVHQAVQRHARLVYLPRDRRLRALRRR